MGLFDKISDVLSGGGRSDVDKGYDRSRELLDPYIHGGREDYDRLRRETGERGDYYNRFGNAGDYMYNHINQSPNSYYDEIMGGYSESPEAKYLTDQANRAATFGASASGMMGSGAFQRSLQENAARIASNDRQRYFNNVMGVGDTQFRNLENLQNQEARNQQMRQWLASMGYGASGSAAGNEINRGKDLSAIDQAGMSDLVRGVGQAAAAYMTGGASLAMPGGGLGGRSIYGGSR